MLLQIRVSVQSMLAKREHSKRELLRKLTQKGFEQALITDVVAELQAENLQSDARFCEMLIRSRCGKGYGRNRIKMELAEHQIADDIAKQALLHCEVDWFALCAEVFAKKFKGQVATDWKARQKQMRYLTYRGFSQEEISAAIGE
ncbi:MAG: regulatory protein RecX [Aestuariibacter sp.]